MYVHTSRKRKKRKGVHISHFVPFSNMNFSEYQVCKEISPEYKLEKIKVNTSEVVWVINNHFGPAFKRAGVKYPLKFSYDIFS